MPILKTARLTCRPITSADWPFFLALQQDPDGGLRRLTACVTEGNQASRHVLEKVGFILEGTLRESYWLQQRWQNDWLLGLLKQEYITTAGSRS